MINFGRVIGLTRCRFFGALGQGFQNFEVLIKAGLKNIGVCLVCHGSDVKNREILLCEAQMKTRGQIEILNVDNQK